MTKDRVNGIFPEFWAKQVFEVAHIRDAKLCAILNSIAVRKSVFLDMCMAQSVAVNRISLLSLVRLHKGVLREGT